VSIRGKGINYAAGPWEEIDWAPFDIVSLDAYRDASNRDYFAGSIRRLFRPGKPVAITGLALTAPGKRCDVPVAASPYPAGAARS
jgi:hypothetical protein